MQKLPHIGLRIIKTGISIMLCLLLAHWLNHPQPIYACFAVIMATRENIRASFKEGMSRILATIVGCIFALAITEIEISNIYLQILIIGASCMFIIYFCVLIKQPGSAALAVIIYLILALTPANDNYQYTVVRLIETIAGIVIAIGINSIGGRKNDKEIEGKVE